MSDLSTYSHTQRAPLHWLLHATAAAHATAAWTLRAQPYPALVLLGVGVIMSLVGLMFRHLTVRDEGDCLALRFGPLPAFRHRIAYREIRAVEHGRSTLLDGWGVHWFPGRGWTYNLWGFDCVTLRLQDRTVRIGSDDAEHLVRFLHHKLEGQAEEVI